MTQLDSAISTTAPKTCNMNRNNYVAQLIFFRNQWKCVRIAQCLSKNCDPASQKCIEPDDEKTKATCICDSAKGYVNTNRYNSTEPTCVLLDPCNKDNRKLMGLDEVACGSEASCLPLARGKNEYICICPDDTFNDNGENIYLD